MLVLTRNIDQSIMIGDNIKITIVGCRGQVSVGIDAPKDIIVHRQEIYEKMIAGYKFEKKGNHNQETKKDE